METEANDIEQLIKGLPLEERVPIVVLKKYYDQRS